MKNSLLALAALVAAPAFAQAQDQISVTVNGRTYVCSGNGSGGGGGGRIAHLFRDSGCTIRIAAVSELDDCSKFDNTNWSGIFFRFSGESQCRLLTNWDTIAKACQRIPF